MRPALSRHLLSAALAAAAALAPLGAQAQDLSLSLVGNSFNQPLFVTAPAGDSRLFIVEKGGTIDIIENGSTLSTPFLNISGLVNTGGERGLLGLAFDPDYANNGRLYVNYTDRNSLNTVVVRYQVSADRNVVDTSTAQTIITIVQPTGSNNHKAGWIGFRPGEANNLYIATGDGGPHNDPDNRAQNLNLNLGKILRIDVSGNTAGYSIPAGNPFVGVPGNDEIWAYGLRNPFRNSFDRLTGDFYIADVGQDTREEVNFVANGTPGGLNFGWRALEGSGDNPAVPDPAPPNATGPIFEYLHAAQPTGAASITGGYVYRGTQIDGLQGTYFLGDYLSGRFTSFQFDGTTLTNVQNRTPQLDPTGSIIGTNSLSSFGEDGFGELYVVDLGGQVYKLVPEPTAAVLIAAAGTLLALRRRR